MRKTYIFNMLIMLLTFSLIDTYAQKLPKIQEAGLRAPVNIKIDGKATEWDKLQAYNTRVEFFYTISNDDKNIYLTIQVPEREVIRRILNGGLTFSINATCKKDDKDSPGITFPVFELTNRFAPRFGGSVSNSNHNGQNILTDEERASMIMVGGKVGIPLTLNQADSLMRENNRLFPAKARSIGVRGIKDIDSLISIYNTEGIKVAATFDNKATYTYELAIPLKFLTANIAAVKKFAYHLIINEIKPPPPHFNDAVPAGSLIKPPVAISGPPPQDATDFWGEYTLAKF